MQRNSKLSFEQRFDWWQPNRTSLTDCWCLLVTGTKPGHFQWAPLMFEQYLRLLIRSYLASAILKWMHWKRIRSPRPPLNKVTFHNLTLYNLLLNIFLLNAFSPRAVNVPSEKQTKQTPYMTMSIQANLAWRRYTISAGLFSGPHLSLVLTWTSS